MKKRIWGLAAVLLLLCLCGCARQAAVDIPAPTPRPTPIATLAPTPTVAPTPAPEPWERLRPAAGAYTIAWISDTQHYSEEYPDTFYAMTAFLQAHKDELDLRYVVHTGDLVQNYARDGEWEVADRAMAAIADIPGGVCAGNHDIVYKSAQHYDRFSRYFGESRYADKPWYGGSYRDNEAHYDLFRAGETDYLFVYLGYDPSDTAVKWARSIFEQYPSRVGILCTHAYFKTNLTRSNTGENLYKKLVKKCPNLYMVLCGHRYNQGLLQERFDDDGAAPARTVYQMMCNYQAAGSMGGGGYLRFMQVDEAQGTLSVYSYSPLAADYNYYDEAGTQTEKYPADPAYEEYTLPLPWIAAPDGAAAVS